MLAGLLVVLIAALLLVLIAGVALMGVGGEANQRYGNRLMVARVWLQAAVLCVLALMFMLGGKL